MSRKVPHRRIFCPCGGPQVWERENAQWISQKNLVWIFVLALVLVLVLVVMFRCIFSCIGLYRLSIELGNGGCSSTGVGLGWRDTTRGIACGPGTSMDLIRRVHV